MAEQKLQLRSTVFGGFNRQDVVNFVAEQDREHSKKMEQLRAELQDSQAQVSSLAEKAEAAANLQKQLEEANARIAEIVSQLAERDAEIEKHAAESRAAAEKAAELERDAMAYRALKDKTAEIELDAHRRAQGITEKAETNAAGIIETAEENAASIRGQAEQSAAEIRADADAYRTGVQDRTEEWFRQFCTDFSSGRTGIDRTMDAAAVKMQGMLEEMSALKLMIAERDSELGQMFNRKGDEQA